MATSRMAVNASTVVRVISIFFCLAFLPVRAAEIEEIIVTAQRREQNVQDVPIAISAFSGANMEAKAINMVAQIADYTPNVYMDSTTPFGASNNILAAYIRGIGQQDFAFNLEPGVGVYVDGVYLARTIGANVDLLDVERLEILKGPQGTLFGRNTIGGAINVVTRRPGDEFKYRGEVTTGSHKRIDVRGAVEGPIVKDTLYGSVAFSSRNRDGYQDRVPFPGIEDNGGDDRFDQFLHAEFDTSGSGGGEDQNNVRGKLLWEVTGDLEITLTGAYGSTDEEAVPSSLLAYFDNPVPGASFTHLADLCATLPLAVLQAIPLPPCFLNRGVKPGIPAVGAPGIQQPAIGGVNADTDPNNDRTLFAGPNFNPAGSGFGSPFIHPDKDKSYANAINFNKLELYDLYSHVDYDLPNDWHLKYIPAYRKLFFEAGFDFDGSPLPMFEVSFDTKQEQWSQELQLSGLSWNDRWQWVAGFYYFHEEGNLTDFVTFPGGFLQIFGKNFFDTDAWALFTHNNFALTDRIGITLGLRYTDEDKEFEGQQRDLNMVSVNPTLPLGFGCAVPAGCSLDSWPDQNDFTRYYPLGVNNKSFTDVAFRAGIEYRLTGDVMSYFSYAEGFKSGGWTTRLSTPHLQIDPLPPGTFLNQNNIGLDMDEEQATTYELGLKTQLLDRTLRLNLAGFYTDYEGIQITKQDGPSPVFANAGDGDIWGFEAEAQWLAMDNLTFEGSVGWLDAEYKNIDDGVFITLISDNPLTPRTPLSNDQSWVNVPEWDINLAGTYTYPLPNGAMLSFRADWAHTSKMANDLSNTSELNQPALDFVNLSLSYTNPTDKWDVTVGGRNVTDERHIITGQVQPAAGMVNGTWNRPAEWFLTLRIRN